MVLRYVHDHMFIMFLNVFVHFIQISYFFALYSYLPQSFPKRALTCSAKRAWAENDPAPSPAATEGGGKEGKYVRKNWAKMHGLGAKRHCMGRSGQLAVPAWPVWAGAGRF